MSSRTRAIAWSDEIQRTPLHLDAGVHLAGEWVEPPRSRAVAVLLPGSGPLDRNGDARRMPLGIQAMLAQGLADAGISSVRWDKRGVGESGGSFLEAGFNDLATDALAVIDAALQKSAPVIVIGHSEGAGLVPQLLTHRPAIAAGVLLSGYARSGLEVLRWQSRALVDDIPGFVKVILRVMRTDLESQTEKNRERLMNTTADVERIGGVRVNARWHREFMAYDPSDDIARATQPVLAITGSFDLQSPPEDLQRIADLRSAPTQTLLLERMSHILRPQEVKSLRGYRRELALPLDERLLPAITSFIDEMVLASSERS